VRSTIQDEYLCISIQDNAGGILKDIFPRVFEFSFTTKEGGSGYGLPSIKSLIETQNGQIEMENIDRGVKTTIKLPLL